MKRITCILLFGLMIFLSGCNQTLQRQVKIEPVEIAKILDLKESQSYILCDYYEKMLLILTYDAEKRNPLEGDRDQAISNYFEKFVLYDIAAQKIAEEFPVEQFGFCSSAVYAFDGILFSFITETTDGGGFDSAIFYLNSQGARKKAYDGNFTPFDLGPILYRNDGAVIFSYQNNTDHVYGIQKINADGKAEPLLTFDTEQIDFISDDFKVSSDYYAYTVGQDDKVTFYIGSANKEPIQISLPEGEKILSFDITSDSLIVSRTNETGGEGVFCVEILDLDGNSMAVLPTQEPLYHICANENSQFCGFYKNTPVEFFEAADTIEHIELDASGIDSTWNYALSNGENFIVSNADDPQNHNLWLVSYE